MAPLQSFINTIMYGIHVASEHTSPGDVAVVAMQTLPPLEEEGEEPILVATVIHSGSLALWHRLVGERPKMFSCVDVIATTQDATGWKINFFPAGGHAVAVLCCGDNCVITEPELELWRHKGKQVYEQPVVLDENELVALVKSETKSVAAEVLLTSNFRRK